MKADTRFVHELDEKEQENLRNIMVANGFSEENIECGMNSRVCDLELILDPNAEKVEEVDKEYYAHLLMILQSAKDYNKDMLKFWKGELEASPSDDYTKTVQEGIARTEERLAVIDECMKEGAIV